MSYREEEEDNRAILYLDRETIVDLLLKERQYNNQIMRLRMSEGEMLQKLQEWVDACEGNAERIKQLSYYNMQPMLFEFTTSCFDIFKRFVENRK